MKKFDLITDAEYDKLVAKYNIMPYVGVDLTKYPKINKLYKYYEKKMINADIDDDCKKINQIIKKAELTQFTNYLENIVIEKGYKFAILKKGTPTYKSLTGYYDKISTNPRIWCADMKSILYYLKRYSIAIAAYKTKKDIKIFIVDDENLNKLISDKCPADIAALIKYTFNLNSTLEQSIKDYIKEFPNKRPFLFKSQECDKNSKRSFFKMTNMLQFYNNQNIIYEYIENKFNCVGTIYGPIVSPFGKCSDIELAIKPEVLEIDHNNEFQWTNWNLTCAKFLKPFEIDVLNASVNNVNNKIYYWLKEYKNIDYTQTDILSINVHNLVPVFKYSVEDTFTELANFVNKVKPKILCLQEMPSNYITKLRNKCDFVQSYYVDNGMRSSDMRLVVYTKKGVPAMSVKNTYDLKRGSIILLVDGKRLMFVHGPIGKSYFRRSKVIVDTIFYENYIHNEKLHEAFLNDIIKHRPDFIIGDFNIIPIQKELLDILCKNEYKTNNEQSTSIHDVKVDYAWYKPELTGKFHVYNWHYSDHRPIGFTFKNWKGISKWNSTISNGIDWDGNRSMSYDNVENLGPNNYAWRTKWNSSNRFMNSSNRFLNSSNNSSNIYRGGANTVDGGANTEKIFVSAIVLLILALILYLIDTIFEYIAIIIYYESGCKTYKNVNT